MKPTLITMCSTEGKTFQYNSATSHSKFPRKQLSKCQKYKHKVLFLNYKKEKKTALSAQKPYLVVYKS